MSKPLLMYPSKSSFHCFILSWEVVGGVGVHHLTRLHHSSLTFNKVLEAIEPVHVEALILIEGHALNEGTKVLVDAEAFKVLGQGRLDSLVQGGEVGTTIQFD